MKFVKVRSWHVAKWLPLTGLDAVGFSGTLCGQKGPFTGTADALPLNEKSCETCLRLAAHKEAL